MNKLADRIYKQVRGEEMRQRWNKNRPLTKLRGNIRPVKAKGYEKLDPDTARKSMVGVSIRFTRD